MSVTSVVPRLDLYKCFDKESKDYPVLYLGAQTGWGKTTAAMNWMKTSPKRFTYLCASRENFCDRLNALCEEPFPRMILDDAHCISDQLVINKIMQLIEHMPNTCSLLIAGRSALPPWLKPFAASNQLCVFDGTCLRFSTQETIMLLQSRGIAWNARLVAQVMSKSKGWPLGVSLLAARLKKEPVFDEALCCQADLDVFDCFDVTILMQWEEDIRHFMLRMAAFQTFTVQMAAMVTGKPNVEALLDRIMRTSSFLAFQPPETYTVHILFHRYLVKKQKEMRSPEFIRQQYFSAGLYYEMIDDLPNALACYEKAGDGEKITELLMENACRSAINACFPEMSRYYAKLPRQTVEASPELMCAMAMLHSLRCNVDESEAWVTALEKFRSSVPKMDSRYKSASESLTYLYIALPHRGSKQIVRLIMDAVGLVSGRSPRLAEISVTGNCPSLMNGGKDFCAWVPHANLLYKILKTPIELVFGRSGAGVANIAIGEVLYEKGVPGNDTEAMIRLNTGLSEAEAKGTLEMQFAASGIMAKLFAAKGSLDTAIAMIDNLYAKAREKHALRLQKNIRAFQIRQCLLCHGLVEAKEWIEREAPDELVDFCILERYRYLTKVRVYIALEDWPKAMLLINRMRSFYELYHRPYGLMETTLLHAVVLHRIKDSSWRDMLDKVLDFCGKYGFVRLIADEGAASLELMKSYHPAHLSAFFRQAMEAARRQAILYPDYLKGQSGETEPLTEAEMNVLRLLAQGKKNSDICLLLGISLRTVKFHTSNIYAKLCVSSRAEAVKAIASWGWNL